ncbi:methyltransferase-like protein 17, mitochondrial isoform X3 [Carassius carassius]|uniref:methyltransferase-like protein 17, mitochondrial isoform X3 n=1 Tax=Carassius carassius TaxID=217509 RepID=UPI002869149E|nr:methyltransferase-like protein 17, mitochondrial isoform X3 [Carassius carassius]
MYLLGSRMFVKCSRCHMALCLKEAQRCQSSAAPLEQADFLKGAPHRKHPGVTNLKTVRLPEQLQVAAQSVLKRAEVKSLTERAHKLSNFLWSRKRATETSQLREKAILLEKKLLEQDRDIHTDAIDHKLEAQIRKRVLSELRRTTYNRTPLRYDEDLGLVYMAARLAGGYAAVLRALNEIKKRDPLFVPYSLLDFGSGLGTCSWASHTLWGDSLKEYVCVDSSGDMNTLAEQLLSGGSEVDNPVIKQVYFRQFLPVSPTVQFDLVIAAFSLSELATLDERLNVIFTLWRKTNSYLVLVENGTKDGHQILMEARDTILKCTHELPCPKLIKHHVVPCNFTQFYYSLSLSRSQERQQEKFSYLIISRSAEEKVQKSEHWDMTRLIAKVHRRPRHVQCQLCCANGELKQLAVTAHRHGKDMYRCARSSDWGDLLPMFHAEDDTKNDEMQ